MSAHEINSIMTRVGNNSRIILAGDGTNQCDITKGPESGAQRLIAIAKDLKSFSAINFTCEDIVRSEFVKNWIVANQKYG